MYRKEYYNVEETGKAVREAGVCRNVIAFVWIFPPWFLWELVSLPIK